MPWFSVFVDQKNLKIIWKFSLSQYRCHITPIDVKNCVKSALNSNHIKQNFTVITIWGGGDYQLRSSLAAKQIWVAVITIWGTLDSLPLLARCFTAVIWILVAAAHSPLAFPNGRHSAPQPGSWPQRSAQKLSQPILTLK